jgi:hypothetical protein
VKKPKFLRNKRIDFSALAPDAKNYFTWHKRPRTLGNFKSNPSGISHQDTAIVLQGDLNSSARFAIETVKLYKKIFPGIQIVISTWATARIDDIEALEQLGSVVVLNQFPKFPGPSNRNLQLVSSNAGLRTANEMGAKYLLKTRLDQRLYSPHALSLMKGLLDKFPLSGPPTSQTERLVVMSNNTFISRIYGVSDFLTFGIAADVLAYWSQGSQPEAPIDSSESNLDVSSETFPEVYFCNNFLKGTEWDCDWTQKDWELALKSRFIVVDGASLDFFWNKYSSREMLWRRYGQIPHLEEVTFGGWLELIGADHRQ